MRKILFFSFLILTFLHPHAQDSLSKSQNTETGNYRTAIDSMYQAYNDSMIKIESERNIRNLNEFMARQNERQQKEKKRMYIRIGLGVFFLVILIIGLRRRSKKQ